MLTYESQNLLLQLMYLYLKQLLAIHDNSSRKMTYIIIICHTLGVLKIESLNNKLK